MNESKVKYHIASFEEFEMRWHIDIADNAGDARWVGWKNELTADFNSDDWTTFVAVKNNRPIGTGTLLLSPRCPGICDRPELANGKTIANISALRVDKEYEGQGHISKLVKAMEQYAEEKGCTRLTIGVEAKETRNLAIYLHWGYNEFVLSETEDDTLVLYYAKSLHKEESGC